MLRRLEKGKYVSRAVFVKLQMERDRLKKDIRVLVMGENVNEYVAVRKKWRKVFIDDKILKCMILEALIQEKDAGQKD